MSDSLLNNPMRPGETTSEHGRVQLSQYAGLGALGVVLTLITTVSEIRELPSPVIITLIITSAVITVAPTLHYIAARTRLKKAECEAKRAAEAETAKAAAQAKSEA